MTATVLGLLMVILVVGMGFNSRVSRSGLFCGRSEDESDSSGQSVKWRELASGQEKDVSHCCFASVDIVEPVPKMPYAGM
jgi:hypothetical protein